jgi:hypothetical protein
MISTRDRIVDPRNPKWGRSCASSAYFLQLESNARNRCEFRRTRMYFFIGAAPRVRTKRMSPICECLTHAMRIFLPSVVNRNIDGRQNVNDANCVSTLPITTWMPSVHVERAVMNRY